MYKDGVYQTIWIDNYFPVARSGFVGIEGGRPIFAAAHGNELWVALAEKAYAKAHGSYMITAGGNCGPTLRDLTGAPSYSYHFNRQGRISGKSETENEFWNDILSGEQMNYAMCAGTPGTDQGQLDACGIVPGHAYTLLSAKEITDRNG
jgi:calpain-15